MSARVELKTATAKIPNEIWFSFPACQEEWVSDRADGFATSLLLLAMAKGEDIEVRGAFSPRLAYGMQEYQKVFNLWFPQQFKRVELKCARYERPPETQGNGRAACAFSGGVDSFYTLWSHLPQNERIPSCPLSAAVFAQGFDIPLQDEATYRTASAAYEEMMKALGLQLWKARTNVRQFLAHLNWELTHGAALIGLAAVLGRKLSRFYVPSSYKYTMLHPWGSHPVLDHLLSTESLEVFHYGAERTRLEKMDVIAHWPETHTRLRVCWVKTDGLNNCCECEKCLRTMVALEIFGALSKFTTFPRPLRRQAIRNYRMADESHRTIARQMIQRAVEVGRRDLAFDLRYMMARNRLCSWIDLIIATFATIGRRLSRAAGGRPADQPGLPPAAKQDLSVHP